MNVNVVTGHAIIRVSAVMVDNHNDKDTKEGDYIDTLGWFLGTSFMSTPVLDLDDALDTVDSQKGFTTIIIFSTFWWLSCNTGFFLSLLVSSFAPSLFSFHVALFFCWIPLDYLKYLSNSIFDSHMQCQRENDKAQTLGDMSRVEKKRVKGPVDKASMYM